MKKEEEKRFLRELKMSAKKEALSKMVQKYIAHILIFIGVIILVMLFMTISSVVGKRRQSKYSDKFYKAVELLEQNNEFKGIQALEEVYGDRKAPGSLRSIAGLKLANLKYLGGDSDRAIKIYTKIYKKEKDLFVKYLAGVSAVNIMINQEDEEQYEKIEKMLKKMDSKKNPLLGLTMEQKGLFEIQRGNVKDGLEVLRKVLERDDVDEDSKIRIDTVIKSYK